MEVNTTKLENSHYLVYLDFEYHGIEKKISIGLFTFKFNCHSQDSIHSVHKPNKQQSSFQTTDLRKRDN